MNIKPNSLSRIGNLVDGLLGELKSPPAAAAIQDSLTAFWHEHVGVAAAHSYPFAYARSKLVIFCDSGVWATRLRHQLPSLKRQLAEYGFSFDDMVLKVNPDLAGIADEAKPAACERTVRQTISKANAKRISNACKHINHRGLQQAMAKLAKHGR